jgi:hypothetical protein
MMDRAVVQISKDLLTPEFTDAFKDIDVDIEGVEQKISNSILLSFNDRNIIIIIEKHMILFMDHYKNVCAMYPNWCICYILQDLDDIDEHLIPLHTSTGCLINETSSDKDTIECVVQLIKATMRKTKDTYPNTNFIPKVRSGQNAFDSWLIRLQQIPGITAVMAMAIANKYPSTKSLIDAYHTQETDKAKHQLLKGIIFGRDRKIGSVISKRVYAILTCNDPDVYISTM